MSKQDQAARIAERAWESAEAMIDVFWQKNLRKAIRRAITAAVRKERERCVGVVKWSANDGTVGTVERRYMCEAIIEAIRKGKA